jgi:hypothetical protein
VLSLGEYLIIDKIKKSQSQILSPDFPRFHPTQSNTRIIHPHIINHPIKIVVRVKLHYQAMTKPMDLRKRDQKAVNLTRIYDFLDVLE